MKIVEFKNEKKYRSKLLEIKQFDKDFCYKKNKDILFFLEGENDKIYGYSIININENIGTLKKIFIIPQLRNNGYGTILLKNIINWLINNNYDNLIVENHKKMDNFLEKQRFIKENNDYILKNLTESKKEQKKMIFISFFAIVVNMILALLKVIGGNIFKSSSLIADGLNSIADLITNVLVILGLKVSGNIEDKEHPFGHGKIESVFSVIIGTFIMITAFDLIKENIYSIINKNENIIFSKYVVIMVIVALLIKIIQFIYIKNKTKNYNGQLINSLLKDYKADIFVTISVIVGIMLSKINPVFDKIVGITVAIYIMKEGYELIAENSLILLDSQDENLLEKIKAEILKFEEVKNAHDFRMTTSGKNVFIFADIRVDKKLSVEEAHEITNKISKSIKYKYKNIKRVILHIEPLY